MSDERHDIPEFRIDRTKITVLSQPDDTDDIEYWRNTTVKERLQHAERLRRIAYGARATERLQRVLRVVRIEES
ncbi:MAG TPA: hypothetical protein VK918_09375 [Pyrinomonadaceae bacterium]|nr:hypothetical protein [Pyrinomonadaceae bacterium]